MVRYNLFLRDATYNKLYEIAFSEGLTVGKKLNMIIDEYVANNELSKGWRDKCRYCEDKVTKKIIKADGTTYFVCEEHFKQHWNDPAREFISYGDA